MKQENNQENIQALSDRRIYSVCMYVSLHLIIQSK